MAAVIESEEEFFETLESCGSQLVVVDFWAEWCGPCRLMTPAFLKFAKDPEFRNVKFLKVDVEELGEVAEKFGISCMPTFMFFRNKKKIHEVSGANKDKLLEVLRELSTADG